MGDELKLATSLIRDVVLPSGFTCFDLLTTKLKEVFLSIESGDFDIEKLRQIAREEIPNSCKDNVGLDEITYALNNGAVEAANYAVFELTWPWANEVVEKVANKVMDAAECSQGAIQDNISTVYNEIVKKINA